MAFKNFSSSFIWGGSMMREQEKELEIGFEAETGVHFMLNKKERILLRAILKKALDTKFGRKIISSRLGEEYIDIGESLLREMGGKVEKT
jgi:hypothetical protein